ncbi:MAG: iron-sulfur cluster insertion protein ErpA [Planctomycetota bacterium]
MLTLTDNAQKKIKNIVAEDASLGGKALRIFVQGGGCSGFSYGFTFGEKRADDNVLACDGFDVVVDPMSAPYLKGSVIDWIDGLNQQGFAIKNPNASSTCGCGHSFSA